MLEAIDKMRQEVDKLIDESKYPPAEPGALGGEPLKAAIGGATRPQ
jgi:hypothetical protein